MQKAKLSAVAISVWSDGQLGKQGVNHDNRKSNQ